jgi:hypothetical protein
MTMGDSLGYHRPVIRKDHPCWWCGETIPKGDRCARWVWAEDGSFSTVRVHLECEAAWNVLNDENFGDGVYFAEHCRGCVCQRGRCDCR